MRSLANTVAVLGALALLVPVLATAQDQTAAVPCAECHDTVAASFQTTPHARALGRDAAEGAVCLSCHAGGREHAEAGGDASLVTTPKGVAGAATCFSCHGGRSDSDIEPKGAHMQAGIACETCHDVHGAPAMAEALLRKPGSELCVTCHPADASSFRKPYTHSMHESIDGSGKAGMQCASCHNPHGRDGADGLKRDGTGEIVCLSCHTDKRGPYVFSHGAVVVNGCMACHEPHGSANAFQLTRSRVQQVCLECHSATGSSTAGSQPPSFHDLRSPRYQNCTTCHVAVHGSNSSPLLLR
jgi:DmsE family decaheme c-type cytochrome